MQIRPRTQTPELQLETVRHGTWRLSERKPKKFTLMIFFRGHH